MSPVKSHFDPENLYFITTTTENRAHFFSPQAHKQIIADSLNYMRRESWFKLHAYVIMPNHIHLIVRFLSPHKLINVMRDFKKFTSKKIIQHCKLAGNEDLLESFKNAGKSSKKNKYKVWEDGYDSREVYSQEFLEQKLVYIHYNPCQPQWMLVKRPEEYPWSSASFYLLEKPAIVPVDDLRELLVSWGG